MHFEGREPVFERDELTLRLNFPQTHGIDTEILYSFFWRFRTQSREGIEFNRLAMRAHYVMQTVRNRLAGLVPEEMIEQAAAFVYDVYSDNGVAELCYRHYDKLPKKHRAFLERHFPISEELKQELRAKPETKILQFKSSVQARKDVDGEDESKRMRL